SGSRTATIGEGCRPDPRRLAGVHLAPIGRIRAHALLRFSEPLDEFARLMTIIIENGAVFFVNFFSRAVDEAEPGGTFSFPVERRCIVPHRRIGSAYVRDGSWTEQA